MILYPPDWQVRLCGAVGGMIGGAIALFVIKPLVELPVWLGPLAFVALIGVGIILGNLVGLRFFPVPSKGTVNSPPQD